MNGGVITIAAVLLTAVLAMFGWMARRLVIHDSALAVLVEQVNPPGKESLRELLDDLRRDVAVISHNNPERNERNGPRR